MSKNGANPGPRWATALAVWGACALAGCGSTDREGPGQGVDVGSEEAAPTVNARTRVVMLGTGTPNADPERSGPSTAVVVDDVAYIVDAGPGVVRRAAEAAAAGVAALSAPRLRIAFLTHLHTDHTVGLPDLIFTPWTLGRDVPLRLFGPPGTARMAEAVTDAWDEDIRMRIDGLEPTNTTGHAVQVTDVTGGVVYQDEHVTVTAFQVPHGSWPVSLAYRFDGPDRSIVISGDTGPSQAIVDACAGCDVLVHEVYAESGWNRRETEWQAYHASFHTSGPELGRLAREARPKLLVLTHQLLWGATAEELLAEIRREYDGPVVFANDLDIY